MASDFIVQWQYSQREQLFFVTDQTPRPLSFEIIVHVVTDIYIFISGDLAKVPGHNFV
jgi:hypothetical protein